MWQPHDPHAASLEQASQFGRTGCYVVRNVHLIVRHQFEAAREKPQDKVGFTGPWWTHHQDRISVPGHAASVHTTLAVHEIDCGRAMHKKKAACRGCVPMPASGGDD
jgi:hypothetical protein